MADKQGSYTGWEIGKLESSKGHFRFAFWPQPIQTMRSAVTYFKAYEPVNPEPLKP